MRRQNTKINRKESRTITYQQIKQKITPSKVEFQRFLDNLEYYKSDSGQLYVKDSNETIYTYSHKKNTVISIKNTHILENLEKIHPLNK